jgi:hypothetical protein
MLLWHGVGPRKRIVATRTFYAQRLRFRAF